MWAAPRVALVLNVGAMLQVRSVAVVAASTKFGIERIEGVRVERADLLPTNQRANMQPRQPPVVLHSVALDVEHLEVPVQQLVHRRAGPRVAALINLAG